MKTTATAMIIFICSWTFSSMNLLVGDIPTRLPLSPTISSISSIARCVSLWVSPLTKVISITASPSL